MATKDIETQRYLTVRKANEIIIKSRFSLSTQQQKILLFLISKIKPTDNNLDYYYFDIKEFCDICGIAKKGNNYNDIKQQISDIADKSIWLELDNDTETLVRWIEKANIKKNDGIIKIKLDEDLKPFLLHLQKNYTQYELIYTLGLKSKYSIRLYEFLKSIHYNKTKPYTTILTIEELKEKLDATTYIIFRDFNTRVLQITYKEINEKTDLIYNYELIKSGRLTTSIKITVQSKNAIERLKTMATIEKELQQKGGKK